ncbi:unnamed protein product [Boreogadus saida]
MGVFTCEGAGAAVQRVAGAVCQCLQVHRASGRRNGSQLMEQRCNALLQTAASCMRAADLGKPQDAISGNKRLRHWMVPGKTKGKSN